MNAALFWIILTILISSTAVFVFSCLAVILNLFNLIKIREDIRKILNVNLLVSIIATGIGLFAGVLQPGFFDNLILAPSGQTISEERNVAILERNSLIKSLDRLFLFTKHWITTMFWRKNYLRD